MRITVKDFWERDEIIASLDVLERASDFEVFMFEKAKERYSAFGEIKTIKVFGVGSGRELESIAEFYNLEKIVASDLSENMISKCIANVKKWGIESITETLVVDAKDYSQPKNTFELVTILNSMLTYVPLRNDRLTIYRNSLQLLKPHGVLIGTVHNQFGAPAKTFYFRLRNFFSFILGDSAGNRDTGFKGFKVPGYYYNKKGLAKDLAESGFVHIEIYSLEDFYLSKGISYNRKKGYNNLIFIASKP